MLDALPTLIPLKCELQSRAGHPGGDGDSQIFVTQPEEGVEPFWNFFGCFYFFFEGQMLLSRNCSISLCVLSLESLQEKCINYYFFRGCTNRVSGWIILKGFAISGFNCLGCHFLKNEWFEFVHVFFG